MHILEFNANFEMKNMHEIPCVISSSKQKQNLLYACQLAKSLVSLCVSMLFFSMAIYTCEECNFISDKDKKYFDIVAQI